MINLDALLSAIQERKALATTAHIEDPATTWYSVDDLTKGHNEGGAGLFIEDARFIAANSPAVVLRQCAVDEEIVALLKDAEAEQDRSNWDKGFYRAMSMVVDRLTHAYAIPTEETP